MMESLSSVRTIVGIALDILAAVEMASRNKSRRERVAARVRCLRDLLHELDRAREWTTRADAAMLERLEEALSGALRQVRRCQRGGFLGSLIVAGGQMADPLDEVEREIDRCLLDLGFATYGRIARLETLLRQLIVAAAVTDDEEDDSDGEAPAGCVHNDNKADGVLTGSGAEKDDENATAVEDVTAIGVPVCTVTAGVHGHEIVPVPSYGYGYCYCYCHGGPYCHRRFSHGDSTGDCWHDYAGGTSDAASYCTRYQPYPSMFSDDNPNACSIM